MPCPYGQMRGKVETSRLLHYSDGIVGEDKFLDGVAVALLYALETVPVAVHLLDEREGLGPTVEPAVAA